jgi:tripartite-type tricarboxylate transporter receptor subunit TctC
MAPIGLPSNIMTELTTASNKALSDPVMIEKLNSLSIQPTVDMTDTKATDFIKHEINKLTPLIQALSIKLAE